MKKQLKKFNVIRYDYPGKVKHYDVLPYFRDRWKEKGKFAKDERAKVVDKATLKSWIIARSQYQFWGRCEYEHCLATWPIGSKRVKDKLKTLLTPDFNLDDYSQSIDFYNVILMDMEKIDVHDQIMMNIDIITDILAVEFKIEK